eukprot:355816-Chlamydomonas_euryale.AAC.3
MAAATGLKTVQLDSQVVLKIIQHCNESLPQLVTGQLLGLDVGQTLEVTDCFAFPVSCLCCPAERELTIVGHARLCWPR